MEFNNTSKSNKVINASDVDIGQCVLYLNVIYMRVFHSKLGGNVFPFVCLETGVITEFLSIVSFTEIKLEPVNFKEV